MKEIQQQLQELEQNPILSKLYDISWNTLQEGVKNRHMMSRVMQIGTFDTHTKQVEIRTVVNRLADAEKQIIRFHTDVRSPKWQQLHTHFIDKTNVAIHIYEPQLKLQIRLQAQVMMLAYAVNKSKELTLNSNLQKNTWKSLNHSQKQTYSLPYVSRETIEKPFQLKEVTFLTDEEAEQHFAMVDLKITEIDTLYLSAFGHIRGLFSGENLSQQQFINY